MVKRMTVRMTLGAAWLACVAMLFAALAPTLTRLSGSHEQAVLSMVVCSTLSPGASAVKVPFVRTTLPEPSVAMADSCPYCSLAAHPPVLPPNERAPLIATRDDAALVPVAGERPPATAPPVFFHPRGPPLLV